MPANSVFSQGPAGTLAADTSALTLGMQFALSVAAPLTGIWFYSAPGAALLPSDCCLFAVAGQGIVTGTQNNAPPWSGAAGSGWVKCPYDGSITLLAGTSYKVAVSSGGGADWYSSTGHFWDTGAGAGGIVSGIITAPDNAGGSGGQDTFATAGALTYPATSFNATNYWADVEVTAPGGGPAAVFAVPDTEGSTMKKLRLLW